MKVARLLGAVAVIATGITACELPITKGTERAWQENFSEALLPAYSDFRGIEVSTDIAWYVFSYRYPDAMASASTIPALRLQIQGSRWTTPAPGQGRPEPCFKVVLETAVELQMQCSILTYGTPGYDEWRFLVDANRHKVTAMYGNLDSPAERSVYPQLLAALRRAHAN